MFALVYYANPIIVLVAARRPSHTLLPDNVIITFDNTNRLTKASLAVLVRLTLTSIQRAMLVACGRHSTAVDVS